MRTRFPDTLSVEGARAAWRAARSFDDVLELGARFVDGRCAHFPGWGAPDTDVETDAIRAHLAALHAHGFLTVASQPACEGELDGRTIVQHAFVAGFACDELAARFTRSTTIAVRAWSADARRSSPLAVGDAHAAVTTVDGVERVVIGHPARADELALFEGEVGGHALRELATASYVAAWDPEPGRADHLWNELIRLAAR